MRNNTPEYLEMRERELKDADEQLAFAYMGFSLSNLRWDWGCRISERSRELLVNELERRGISMRQFEALGRGKRAA